jgi:hypothetical protein
MFGKNKETVAPQNGWHRLVQRLRMKVQELCVQLEDAYEAHAQDVAAREDALNSLKVTALRMRQRLREYKEEGEAHASDKKLLLERAGRIALLEQKLLRLQKAIAARDAWEGCDVATPAGRGTCVGVGATVDVLLEAGHVWRGTCFDELKRLTAPDADRARELRLLLEELREDGAIEDQPITGDVELLYYGEQATPEEIN